MLLVSDGTTLQPDYAQITSHLDFYRGFAIKYMGDKADLDLLNCVGHNQNTFYVSDTIKWVMGYRTSETVQQMVSLWDQMRLQSKKSTKKKILALTMTAQAWHLSQHSVKELTTASGTSGESTLAFAQLL